MAAWARAAAFTRMPLRCPRWRCCQKADRLQSRANDKAGWEGAEAWYDLPWRWDTGPTP